MDEVSTYSLPLWRSPSAVCIPLTVYLEEGMQLAIGVQSEASNRRCLILRVRRRECAVWSHAPRSLDEHAHTVAPVHA